jgi:hypothetical protein
LFFATFEEMGINKSFSPSNALGAESASFPASLRGNDPTLLEPTLVEDLSSKPVV